jgi:hypothetical protein
MAMPRHIGGKHSDPAIGDLARRASVLERNSARSLALFQKAGLVDNQNRVLIGKRFQRVLTDNVAQCVGITPPQDSPLAPRSARIQPVLRGSPPKTPSRNCPAEVANRCPRAGKTRNAAQPRR